MTDAPEGPPPASKRRKSLFTKEDIESRTHAFEEDFKAQVAVRRAQLDATTVKIEERTGRNLPLAILIGVGLGVALLASLIFEKAFFMVFAAALVGFTSFELASALRFSGRHVSRLPTVIAGLALVPASFYLGADGRWLVLLGGIAFVSVWRLIEVASPKKRVTPRQLLIDVSSAAFVQVYISFLGTFAVLITSLPNGQWWTLAFLITVVSVDVGAYATGLSFGKHPMAPRISPKKTWEGFAGSVAAAVLAGILLSIFMIGQPWWFGFILGGAMVFTGTIGDLTESLIKRDLGIKDISTWLPGHGGFLDRLDSILPSAAGAYILYLIFA